MTNPKEPGIIQPHGICECGHDAPNHNWQNGKCDFCPCKMWKQEPKKIESEPQDIGGWEARFDEAVRGFGYKYSSDDVPDMYAVSRKFLNEQFKELFAAEIKKEKEAYGEIRYEQGKKEALNSPSIREMEEKAWRYDDLTK